MRNTGRFVEAHGQYEIRHWTGPQVDSGEMKPYSSGLRGQFGCRRHDTLEEARAHAQKAPKLRTVRVSFEAYIPVASTEEQIVDWIEFELHANGSIDTSNPLERHSLDARNVDVEFER